MKRFGPLLLLICLILAFFYKTILFGKLPVPTDTLVGLYHPWRDIYADTNPRGIPFTNFLITDPVRQQIPWRKTVIDQWKKGTLPLYDRFSFGGTSLIGNIQAGVLYPLNFLFFLFSFSTSWAVLIIIQPILAGLFMYFFLRNKKYHEVACLTGALAFAFSGFSVAWLTWGTMLQTLLWLPLILFAIDKRSLLLLVGGVIASSLAGHIQIFFYVSVVSFFYLLWTKPNRQTVASFFSGIVIAAALLFPAIQNILQSTRLSLADVTSIPGWFIPWQHAVQFVAPDFFGNPATLNYWGEWNYGEMVGFVGIISLLFALSTCIFIRDRFIRFMWMCVIVAFVFAAPNVLSMLPYQLHLPVIASLQPTRLLSVIVFGLAVLSAAGFDHVLRGKVRGATFASLFLVLILSGLWLVVLLFPNEHFVIAKRNLFFPSIIYSFGAVALAALVFFNKVASVKKFGAYLIVVILVVDLFRFGWKFTPFTDPVLFFPESPALKKVSEDTDIFRVASLDSSMAPPNTLAYYGIEGVDGYDPIVSKQYGQFAAAIERGKPDISEPFGFNRIISIHNTNSPLFRFLNVKYALSLTPIQNSQFEEIGVFGMTHVYRNLDYLPRFLSVSDVIVEANPERHIALLSSSGFDPATSAVVFAPINLVTQDSDALNIIVQRYDSGFIELLVSGTSNQFLVMLTPYDKQWHAYIDGQEVIIHKANFLFQGIVVPQGEHTVVFRYTII